MGGHLGKINESQRKLNSINYLERNIIEYHQRFGDFDGFLTPDNVESLMK